MDKSGFLIPWRDLEPINDIAWFFASEIMRNRYRREAARIVPILYRDEREQGIDRFGQKLAALKPKTIKYRRSHTSPVDKFAPPLIPAHEKSRTSDWLRVEMRSDGIFCRWIRNWGEKVYWHATGQVRGAPARDVMGISPRGMKWLRDKYMAGWWKGRRISAAMLGLGRPLTKPEYAEMVLPQPLTIQPIGVARFDRQVETITVGHIETFKESLTGNVQVSRLVGDSRQLGLARMRQRRAQHGKR